MNGLLDMFFENPITALTTVAFVSAAMLYLNASARLDESARDFRRASPELNQLSEVSKAASSW